MERVILTGATGAIGMALIRELRRKEYEVTVVCHRGSERNQRMGEFSDVRRVECNVEEIKKLPELAGRDYDLFYHMAWAGTTGTARDEVALQLNNVKYTIDAVEAAAAMGCRRFIGVGSQAEYGRWEGVLKEQTPTRPETGYGMAKLAAGQLSRLRSQQLSLEHIWVRILSVYGPYDTEKSLIQSIIRQLLRGESPACTEGEQIWDYLYAEDAAKALRLLGERGKDQEVYCLGGGHAEPLRNYIEKVRRAVSQCVVSQLQAGRSFCVPTIQYGAVPYAKNQVMHLEAELSKLKRDTEYLPDTPFEEGIKKTVMWCRKESL